MDLLAAEEGKGKKPSVVKSLRTLPVHLDRKERDRVLGKKIQLNTYVSLEQAHGVFFT